MSDVPTSTDSSPPPTAGVPAPRDAAPGPEVIRASLRHSIKDASAWAFMQGAASNHIATFVVLERAGLLYVAAVAAFPALIGAITQWLSADLTDRVGSRNRIIVPTATVQALAWLPMCVAVFLPFEQLGYWIMLVSYVAVVSLGNVAGPAWNSIMGDLVPPERRGRYFGLRNVIWGSVQMVSFFAAGWWVTWCATPPKFTLFGLTGQNTAFLAIFAAACVARLISAWYLSRIYDPPYRVRAADRFTLVEFVRRAPYAHFGRFVGYSMLMQAAFSMVTPFLGWHLMGERHYGAGAFSAVITIATLVTYGTQQFWGRLLDRIGTKHVLAIGGITLIAVPLLLLLSRSFWHYAAVMVVEGAGMGAYTLALSNYLFDAVTPPKRARCAAYHTLFFSLGTALGAFVGALVGMLGAAVGPVWCGAFTWMLLGSAALRVLTNATILRSFGEFRFGSPTFPPA